MLEREGKTIAGIRNLKLLIPPSRKITKTDLSKYECAWMLKPHIVSKGAQKNFIEYMEIVSGESEEERTSPDTNDFKEIVSKAILYRSIHKKILKRFAAFQANITAYSFSVIVKIHGERINLGMIWGEQAVSSELLDYACNISDLVRDSLENSSKGKMISEWAKKEECWEIVSSNHFNIDYSNIKEIE